MAYIREARNKTKQNKTRQDKTKHRQGEIIVCAQTNVASVPIVPIGGVGRLYICESHGSSGRVTAVGW